MTSPGYPRFDDPSCGRQLPVLPGDVVAGKYRVERVVGSGAMGSVVLAVHIELEQPVAIKFMHPELATDEVGAERFRREARAVARIVSPFVARVLDVGELEDQGIPFIVMEYLDGRDLARELHARGPLPVHEAVAHVLEACEAVAEAHNQGIVHRDLKPANLFLAKHANGTRTIKVLDFGISKMGGTPAQPSITDTAVLMGSPAYMSPEQLESSRSVDPRSDIWAFGVILHELVSGALPFTGETVPQLIRAIVTGVRKPLGKQGALAELERVVRRCLSQERADRYQTVPELGAALQRIARSNTSAAGRTLLGYPARPALSGANRADQDLTPRPVSGGADGWGRTHGGRRGTWQRHRLPLAASLGLLAVATGWGVRARRSPDHAEKPVLITVVAPLAAGAPAAVDAGLGGARREPGRPAEPVIARSSSTPQVAAVAEPSARPPELAAIAAPPAELPIPQPPATPSAPAQPVPAASEVEADAPDASTSTNPAPPAALDDTTNEPDGTPPSPEHGGRFEIREFGGRK